MKRWQASGLVALLAVVPVAIPIVAFFLQAKARPAGIHAWVIVLIPNLILILLIGGTTVGLYLFVTRSSRRPPSPPATPPKA
jgi:hypothetical protein